MKNPKLAHSINSIKDESSIVSLKEDNINDYINRDWYIVYDAIGSVDFNKIYKYKSMNIRELLEDQFFLDLMGLSKKFIK